MTSDVLKRLAVIEITVVLAGIIVYIWRWQFRYPDFALYLLGFIVLTFMVHRDKSSALGIGMANLLGGLKVVWAPTVAIAAVLVAVGLATEGIQGGSWASRLVGLPGYFAWALLQQFGLQSFLANRLLLVFGNQRRAAAANALIFAAFHVPNPILMPVTLIGGYLLTRVFYAHRNIVPLAFSHALIGSLLTVAAPAAWHHHLRVGPGFFR